MQENRHFEKAYKNTMLHEGWGKETNDPQDPGGHSWAGISRVYWPHEPIWQIIDTADRPLSPEVIDRLMAMAKDFYKKNFWDIFHGDTRSEFAPEVAAEIFDTAVNCGPGNAVRFLQQAYNIARGASGEELVVDGRLGPKTVAALKEYLAGGDQGDEEILLNCMNGEQYVFYKENPGHKYFLGWFRRV